MKSYKLLFNPSSFNVFYNGLLQRKNYDYKYNKKINGITFTDSKKKLYDFCEVKINGIDRRGYFREQTHGKTYLNWEFRNGR